MVTFQGTSVKAIGHAFRDSVNGYREDKELSELVEHAEIFAMVQERMQHYGPSKCVPWEQVKGKHGL